MASFLGLGSDNVYLIHCNSKGKMDVQHLEREIQRALEEGAAPFMVSATAGKRNNEDLQRNAEKGSKNSLSIQHR
jgi:Pyridoxal-dependent decarboxylase conserved domain.